MKFCSHCGKEIVEAAVACPNCGCAVAADADVGNMSPKSRLVALLLCFFIGTFGIHRFYVGKVGTGVLWLLTLGGIGIGVLVDFIMIACGRFTDKQGLFVKNWETN